MKLIGYGNKAAVKNKVGAENHFKNDYHNERKLHNTIEAGRKFGKYFYVSYCSIKNSINKTK